MANPQLVLQPRGGPEHNGPANFKLSVQQGIRLAEYADALGEHLATLESLYPNGLARLWGSTPPAAQGNRKAAALRDRRIGDRVLFYAHKGFIAEATILYLFRNATAANAIWGADKAGATWEHIMALGHVRELTPPIPAEQVLAPLAMSVPLRSITLVSAADHAKLIRETFSDSSVGEPPREAGQVEETDLSRSTGWQQDPKKRRAVENHAVELAIVHYERCGWHVTEVGKPYDLRCRRGREERHVEVKGTTGPPVAVELTVNEVDHARSDQVTDLFVVSEIGLDRDCTASGGNVRLYENWSPAEADLQPTRFMYRLPVS